MNHPSRESVPPPKTISQRLERRAGNADKIQQLVTRYLVPDVRTTTSVLQYHEVLREPGIEPIPGQQVTVH